MSVFMQPIYTATSTGSVGAIVFNNIPQGFTDLKLVISARTAGSDSDQGIYVQPQNSFVFNGTYMRASGTGGYSNYKWFNNNAWVELLTPSGAMTANVFSNHEMYITNYSGGTFKTMVFEGSSENNTAGYPAWQMLFGGVYSSTNPITRIEIGTNRTAPAFAAGSTFTLYGISNTYDTAIPAAPSAVTATDLAGVTSVSFTQNDSGQGQTADDYSIFDSAIMAAPVYGDTTPIRTPVNLNATYTITASANNALGSATSGSAASVISYNNYASIATYTVPAGPISSMTFSNIPQDYKHLQIRIMGKEQNNGTSNWLGMVVQFNGDGSSSYSWHEMGTYATTGGGGQTNSASAAVNQTSIYVFPHARGNGDATTPSTGIIDIYEYTSQSRLKTIKSVGGFVFNPTANNMGLTSGTWRSFSPISSILVSFGANWQQGTTISLYGVS